MNSIAPSGGSVSISLMKSSLMNAATLTSIADRPQSVSDEIRDEATQHFDQPALASLIVRSRPSTPGTGSTSPPARQVSGEWTAQYAG